MKDLFNDNIKQLDTSIIFEDSYEEGSSTLKIP